MAYDDYETIRFERSGDILTVFISDPAATPDSDFLILDELARLFHDLRNENEARAIVLTGAGQEFYSGLYDAAGSLEGMKNAGVGMVDMGGRGARRTVWDLLDVEVPIVAALNGDAGYLGATIALFCDVIFMSETATISDPHVHLGIVAGDGGVGAWPLAMGPALAKRYLLTGDPVTAQEAARMGLVTHVCPADRVLAEATAFAHRLAARAPLAVRGTKIAINHLIKDTINGAFERGLNLELMTFLSEDMVEALTAAREGRTPKFTGK
ncbi:enoyl-CoA hydratase-related protein [Nonomuraea sp. NPDC049695]|uniref:enoyl-CoA hydratase/isomerase family protein n=1 Tax=Nonomuraea sp. NPDC049695 TaxID=3154734 RepID=UPI00342CCD62